MSVADDRVGSYVLGLIAVEPVGEIPWEIMSVDFGKGKKQSLWSDVWHQATVGLLRDRHQPLTFTFIVGCEIFDFDDGIPRGIVVLHDDHVMDPFLAYGCSNTVRPEFGEIVVVHLTRWPRSSSAGLWKRRKETLRSLRDQQIAAASRVRARAPVWLQ